MMKKTSLFITTFILLAILLFAATVPALGQDIVGFSNLINGDEKAGVFEINGTVINNGQIGKVAVKLGDGPWETARGVNSWQLKVNAGQLVTGYKYVYDSALGKFVKTYERGPYYGNLNVTAGAFDVSDNKIAEKTISIKIVPEKPYGDIASGLYSDPLDVTLKAGPNTTIYYTNNGSDPVTNGYYYSGAIYVYQDTLIKAVARSDNYQYSQPLTLDIKISAVAQPVFSIQYFQDEALTRQLPETPYLKAGIYYLKITTNKKYSSGPDIDIDAPGFNNDVSQGALVKLNDFTYRYTRTIITDTAATGETQEVINFSGIDNHGNSVQNIAPLNLAAKAAYPDTTPPAQGSIALSSGMSTTNDLTPLLTINSPGAAWMRFALSEAGLAVAPWVGYAAQYDEFDISSGGNGAKSIWVEFKDLAGNIQTAHSFTAFNYDNTILSFDVEYFSDIALTHSLGNNPYLKAGTYYLKITANQEMGYNPTVQINAEGTNNDVPNGLTTMINPHTYYYTRTITADALAVGHTKEQITVAGHAPSNIVSKAPYTDTVPPGIPTVNGAAATDNHKPAWSWNVISGAAKYRYSFTDGSNWIETTATSFTPDNAMADGNYTLYVQASDSASNWSASGSFTTLINAAPEIIVKKDSTNIPNITGVFDFGRVQIGTDIYMCFSISNYGTSDLNLTGNPIIQITGTDASQFKINSQPATPVASDGTVHFWLHFYPTNAGFKTATISIASDDNDQSPYEFTVCGTAISAITLPLNTWTEDTITINDSPMYVVNTTIGRSYAITWDDSNQGSGVYPCNITVYPYRKDLTGSYYIDDSDSGYTIPKVIVARDDIVYLKIYTNMTGKFAIKITELQPGITVKQGATEIPNGTGSYDFGSVSTGSTINTIFTVANTGLCNLNLTGSPKIQLKGANASEFSVTAQPSSAVVASQGTITFKVALTPLSVGLKTATVSVTNDDDANNPYEFTITGLGAATDVLPIDTWTAGNLGTPGDVKMYCFNAIIGKTYAISWDDSFQGSGSYNCDIIVAAYQPDLTSYYFNNTDSGYVNPQIIAAQDNLVYIKVVEYNSDKSGSFALKVSAYGPEIKIKQDTVEIPSGTGSYDFGNVSTGSVKNIVFTVQNTGSTDLNLTGNPKVQISGMDAAQFSVIGPPSSPISSNGSTAFGIAFAPIGLGAKTATVCIVNDDTDKSSYEFTITGEATSPEVLTLDTWTPRNIAIAGDVNMYSVNVTSGQTYAIRWDDNFQGSGSYNGNIKVSCYRQDLTTAYFSNIYPGYISPQIITPLDNVIYIKVAGYSSGSTGSYALKASIAKPAINIKQGTAIISNNGTFDCGNVAIGVSKAFSFTLENLGTLNLNLTGSPRVLISGGDASQFSVTSQPYSQVPPFGIDTFNITFTPTSLGLKTATVSIVNDDTDKNPYQFTVTGTGVSPEVLTPDTWTQGTLNYYNIKFYSFNAVSGKTYAISWDDGYQGTGTYTGNISVTAYRQDLTTNYFSSTDSGFTTPKLITAQEDMVYLKLYAYIGGSYALKVSEIIPEPVINVKQGSINIPSGTGSYDFGNISLSTSSSFTFTLENPGTDNLNLTGSPKVQISGVDASQFSVTTQPSSPVSPFGNTYFYINFFPTSSGLKTATVSIASDDADKNPYQFTITGTGAAPEVLALDTWTQGTITINNFKMYSFNVVSGKSYTIRWDDSYQGSGTYTSDIKVTGYQQNLTTTYFSVSSGYTTPQIVTAQDNTVYLKVYGYSTGSYALKVSEYIIPEPVINVKQGATNIPNGAGSYDYGNVSTGSTRNIAFTIQNTGNTNLNLTGSPKVQISGTDASQFSVTSQPSSTVASGGSVTFVIAFTPSGSGAKTATVSIASDDTDKNPYEFIITGTGTTPELLTSETWTPGNITSPNNVNMYSFNVSSGQTYAIRWDDYYQGSGSYNCDIKVTCFREDLTTAYFSNIDSGYTSPQIITALDNVIYIKVAAYSSGSTGTYALKAFIAKPAINIKQGTTIISNNGTFDFENVSFGSSYSFSFTLENQGALNLYLTGSPRVQISGADASQFSITTQPSSSSIAPFGNTYFYIQFFPTSLGLKTATVSIASNDPDKNPFEFTITGTGTTPEVLTFDTWTQGTVTANYSKIYSFNAVNGKTYAVNWDDSNQGSGAYTGNIIITGCRPDLTTYYFSSVDSGYTTPQLITAQDNIAYLRVYAYSTGSYALKVSEIIPEPIINVKQGSTNIQSGTGSYDFGNVSLSMSRSIAFTLENPGTGSLNLTGSPKVQISGADASQFSVTSQPSSQVAPFGNTNFYINFIPTSSGLKTATVSIANNDTDKNPYQFTITGTGAAPEVLTLDTWTQGNLTFSNVKIYSFNAVSGKTYAVSWDDSYQGSHTYTSDIEVTGYRQNLTTTYFSSMDSGYNTPQIMTAQDNTVYLKVYANNTGSYALKVSEIIPEPIINVKQGSINIPSGTGSYDFGNIALCMSPSIMFTLENSGTGYLNLTGSPKVQISGADASQFSVTIQPSSPVSSSENTYFYINFFPTSSGLKTATVSIASDDADNNPYQFTITGTGATSEALTFDTWTQGNLTSSNVKTYSFNAVSGKTYAVSWDDSYQGSGTYTSNINVTGYHQNLTTTYFSSMDSGYITPQIMTAQENTVYLKVYAYNTGSYALKVSEIIPGPIINVKQNTTNIPNGTGSFDFGNVSLSKSSEYGFWIENPGTSNLNLTGSPKVQISGTDASQFSVTSWPVSPILPNGSMNFEIKFFPTSAGLKTAIVSIASDDTDKNPYLFTITGTGTELEVLTPGIWTQGTLATDNNKTYSFNAVIGKSYVVNWDDKYVSGNYTADIGVSGLRQNLSTGYFYYNEATTPEIIIAQDNIVYFYVNAYEGGSYALKVTEVIPEPVINIKQNAVNIPNGAGSYDFGTILLSESRSIDFILENLGTGNLNLTGSPKVQISGADASQFTVTMWPSSLVAPNGSTYFSIRFFSTSSGLKTATVNIASDDSDKNPYQFTVTGTGTAPDVLTLDTWTQEVLTNSIAKIYSFNAVSGKTYAVNWDDCYEGSGVYTSNIDVTGYRQNFVATYFDSVSSGYTKTQFITSQDNIVYLKVKVYGNSYGSYAIKVSEIIPEPSMNVKQGTTIIPSGTGSYDFGNIALSVSRSSNFTIENSGTGNLSLSGNPKVQISGADASQFSVTTQPLSPVAPYGSTIFKINFLPTSAGLKTATISIVNDDADKNLYEFTVTGTGDTPEVLNLDTWTQGTLTGIYDKIYSFNAVSGKTYTVNWDNGYEGTGNYTSYISVTGYWQDFLTKYFNPAGCGYTIPQLVNAQENVVYLKVHANVTGSFALKVTEVIPEPIINVKQGTVNIPNGAGSFDFGHVSKGGYRRYTFTIENSGTGQLNLTGSPKVQLKGVDALQFIVNTQPSSPVTPFGSTTFYLGFLPASVGFKTATVSIASDDADKNPYEFTITGTSDVPETLALDTWNQRTLTLSGEQEIYSFNVISGHKYAIWWDDYYQGSGLYTCDIIVSGYRQDLMNTYFTNVNSGYSTSQIITAQDDVIYFKVGSYLFSPTGSFALKVTEIP